ncbi:methylmalonyl-CoA mutase subunit beta [Muriicola soli]|uniref:Methylmalonyl-CoA mutase n=1 Tax=Muriicola soli TaxID=2507538 RepID=A0A411EA20_9FLAO|nr:methylmalonyl-CoA mutase subunit beta [Muriicola soli]QBA64562.1 methylmalonyl-CoA mutase [Muriicola soli]
MSKKNEFYDFPPTSTKAWKQQIQYGLKGQDYNYLLVWNSPDQIAVKPFYNTDDLEQPPARGLSAEDEWKVGQPISVEDTEQANARALRCLEKGAESLFFKLHSPDIDLRSLLKGIDLKQYPVHLEINFLADTLLGTLKEISQEKKASFIIHFDVIGNLARTGNWFRSMKEDLDAWLQLNRELEGSITISIDGSLYQNAGAIRVQQLAYMLSQAHEYVHHLKANAADVKMQIPVFKVSVNSNYFFEIAKLRALRQLWATLAREYDAPEHCHIVAQPSQRNKTIYEYNSNLLRSTMECMAAVNGGADTVCNLPYDSLYQKENEFGDRIARNQLLILKNESYLGAVSNPADGAYYIETLTKQMAEKALSLFKQLEASGGFLYALKAHTIQPKIKEQATKEQERFDQGSDILVGSNGYQNNQEAMKDNLEVSPFMKFEAKKTLIEPILEKRLAESLEKKRLEHE